MTKNPFFIRLNSGNKDQIIIMYKNLEHSKVNHCNNFNSLYCKSNYLCEKKKRGKEKRQTTFIKTSYVRIFC